MKEKGPLLLSGIFIFLFITGLFINMPARGDDGKEYEQFLKQPGLYSKIINYLRKEQEIKKSPKAELKEEIILFAIDLSLSLFCLWLAILFIVGKKTLLIKGYSWFLFSFNFAWFIALLFFRIAWQVLDFLVVRLRPDLGPPVIDNFSLLVIVAAVLIYIWVLARTFELNFFGAVGTFLVSHLCYLLVIFLFFSCIVFKDNRFFNFAKGNLGVRPIIRSYLLDVKRMISGQDIVSFIRVRPFHL